MRMGIDWGGTKIEILALDDNGMTLERKRLPTPHDDYAGGINVVCELVKFAENSTGQTGSIGVGIPGTISPITGFVKNGNSLWMNGQPLLKDLQEALGREIRIQNDANCFAVSEAVDGAGKGAEVVAGVIVGTGCGCGIAINAKAHSGRGGIAGELGHTPLAPLTAEEFPGNACGCGKISCLETYISGPSFERDYDLRLSKKSGLKANEILELDTPERHAAYSAYVDRFARGLGTLINILSPDVIVLGGGMSNVQDLYKDLPTSVAPYVFTEHFDTPILPAIHGDSSGVRGAAWLW